MNIIKLAQEAELLKEDGTEPYRWGVEHLQHFAELVLEAARAYDQTALELCETCGWKAIVPGDGCLVCAKSWVDITDGELFDLWMKSPAETEDRFAFVRKALAMQKERNT
jgi:hypothetical protein